MIKVQNLSKSFGKKQVLRDLSFTVYDGEVYGLLGQNSSGKTTTLRILSTLLKPTSGTGSIEGYDILKDPLFVRKSLGFLPEEAGLYDRLTPRETLTYYGKLHNLNGGELVDRVDFLISLLRLEEFANVKCSKLSKGTKQKVSIARCLVHNPPVLLLDELTSNIDTITAFNIKTIILDKLKRTHTIIISTHNMFEAERICDRAGLIYGGEIFVEGSIEELKDKFGEDTLEKVYIKVYSHQNDG